jgi:hypothetical protein
MPHSLTQETAWHDTSLITFVSSYIVQAPDCICLFGAAMETLVGLITFLFLIFLLT